jgi:hypothetical protein
VNLDIHERTIGLAPLVGVARITMLVEVAVRSSAIGEEDHHLMNRLGILTEIVLTSFNYRIYRQNSDKAHPESIRVLQVRLRIPLLCVDKVGKLGGITDEEDGGVVEHPIPVTLLSSELDSKATGITSSIR